MQKHPTADVLGSTCLPPTPEPLMSLTPTQSDRAVGALLGSAAGDALGAGYEFGPALPDGAPVHMKGGGGFGWEPGEWDGRHLDGRASGVHPERRDVAGR